MTNSAPRGRLAIAPPALEAPSASEATQIVPARRDRSDASGEFSKVPHSALPDAGTAPHVGERPTLPEMGAFEAGVAELEPMPVPVIDLDELGHDGNDTIPAPTWLGDD